MAPRCGRHILAAALGVGSGFRQRAQISLLSAALHGCYLALQVAEQLGLEPCVAAEAGVARGHGVNVLDIAHPSAPWAAVFAGLSLRQRSRSGLVSSLLLEIGAPLYRPNYVVADYGPVFHASPVVGRATIDLAWTFP